MLRYLIIILATLSVPLNGQKVKKFVDLIDALVRDGGQWILAAAASTFVPPPYKSCVNITAKLLLTYSECILSNLNLTMHTTRHVQFIGQNEDGDVEIRSKGPIHQYLIKRRTERHYTAPTNPEIAYTPLLQEVEWEAAVNQPLCWRPKVRPYKFVNYRYVITPVTLSEEVIYVVGIKKRYPIPEYEVAILTKGKKPRKDVERWINIIDLKNYEKMAGCREDLGRSRLWPPNNSPEYTDTIPYYWTYFVYCLPRLHIKCAIGYDILDTDDPVNFKTPHEEFRGKKTKYKSMETESLYVLHKNAL